MAHHVSDPIWQTGEQGKRTWAMLKWSRALGRQIPGDILEREREKERVFGINQQLQKCTNRLQSSLTFSCLLFVSVLGESCGTQGMIFDMWFKISGDFLGLYNLLGFVNVR